MVKTLLERRMAYKGLRLLILISPRYPFATIYDRKQLPYDGLCLFVYSFQNSYYFQGGLLLNLLG